MVDFSTTKVEDIIVTKVGLKSMWIKALFGKLGFELNKVELLCINQVKYVEVKFQLIRDIFSQGIVAVEVFHVEDNPVTKVTKSMIQVQ